MSLYESSSLEQLRRIVDELAAQAATIGDPCGCDPDELLPCESHSVTLAQYEGASLRTADELLRIVLAELTMLACAEQDKGAHGAHAGTLECAAAVLDAEDCATLAELESSGGGWLESDELREAGQQLVSELESELPSELVSVWSDGWQLYRITGGPLSEQGSSIEAWLEDRGALDIWANAELRIGRAAVANSVTVLDCAGGPGVTLTVRSSGAAVVEGSWGSDTYRRHLTASEALQAWAEDYMQALEDGGA